MAFEGEREHGLCVLCVGGGGGIVWMRVDCLSRSSQLRHHFPCGTVVGEGCGGVLLPRGHTSPWPTPQGARGS